MQFLIEIHLNLYINTQQRRGKPVNQQFYVIAAQSYYKVVRVRMQKNM